MKILKSRIPFELFMTLISIMFLIFSSPRRLTDISFGVLICIGFFGLIDSILTLKKANHILDDNMKSS